MIDTPSDGKGTYLYRSVDGTGTVSFQSVQLRWNYGVDGLTADEPDVEVQVIGIEMVYVSQGVFAAGSGGTETQAFTLTTINMADATVSPFRHGIAGRRGGGLPDYRNGIEIQTPGVASTMPAVYANDFTDDGGYDQNDDGQDIACNFLNWADGAAYADWAGLRPMTELEYVKASRGTRSPVVNEYAWSTTNLHASAYTITNKGLANATVNAGSGTGNASYDVTDGLIDGPLQVGIFAASPSSRFAASPPSRQEAGATFYGVMEMSGNLWERPVTIGNATGRAFTGTHGDGVLTSSGEADAGTWPPGATAVGAGSRGGAWSHASTFLRVSDRVRAANTIETRSRAGGFRAVRSAP